MGVLHHRIVDRVGGASGERRLAEANEIGVAAGLGQRLPARGDDIGAQPFELIEKERRWKQKDPAVPEIFARSQIGPR